MSVTLADSNNLWWLRRRRWPGRAGHHRLLRLSCELPGTWSGSRRPWLLRRPGCPKRCITSPASMRPSGSIAPTTTPWLSTRENWRGAVPRPRSLGNLFGSSAFVRGQLDQVRDVLARSGISGVGPSRSTALLDALNRFRAELDSYGADQHALTAHHTAPTCSLSEEHRGSSTSRRVRGPIEGSPPRRPEVAAGYPIDCDDRVRASCAALVSVRQHRAAGGVSTIQTSDGTRYTICESSRL